MEVLENEVVRRVSVSSLAWLDGWSGSVMANASKEASSHPNGKGRIRESEDEAPQQEERRTRLPRALRGDNVVAKPDCEHSGESKSNDHTTERPLIAKPKAEPAEAECE